MDYIKAKIYEYLIKRKARKREKINIIFIYSRLVRNGFKEKYIKPNTENRVTIYFEGRYDWDYKQEHKTYKNIKEAYYYFK